jgi:hypothetical protein
VSRPRVPPRDPAWTVEQACTWFADGGIPIDPDPARAPARLRLLIRALKLTPVGKTESGEQGGLGKALYDVADLMRLHAAIAPWLVMSRRQDPGNSTTDT